LINTLYPTAQQGHKGLVQMTKTSSPNNTTTY